MIKYVAPELNALLRAFDRHFLNASKPSAALSTAMTPLFTAFTDLQPLKENDEAKAIWITVPRGKPSDFGDYEEMKEEGEVDTPEEFDALWKSHYPTDPMWYRVVINQSLNKNGTLYFRGIGVDDRTIVSAAYDDRLAEEGDRWIDDYAIKVISFILPCVNTSMEMLRSNTYNDFVLQNLPYFHRTGVIRRSDLWKAYPENKDAVFEGLSAETFASFKAAITSGENSLDKIGRIKSFTANDFFRACSIGYRACGYDIKDPSHLFSSWIKGKNYDGVTELSPLDQYFSFADGRDEGLSGRGSGLNAGPGIDFEDPKAWDAWYFNPKRGGGHPWEVCAGGNSTHVDLFVRNDKNLLGYLLRAGKISEEEYHMKMKHSGYYFEVAGNAWNRSVEAVNFYVAIKAAGYPVVIRDGDALLSRFEGTDYVGIVPHDCATRYCEGMFPRKYGTILDFMHVYDEDMEKIGKEITWLPEDPAVLLSPER